MRTEEIMRVIASLHDQTLEELIVELGVGPMQLDALVQYILAVCGRRSQ